MDKAIFHDFISKPDGRSGELHALAIVLLLMTSGCALSGRTVGTHDATVDIAQANAAAERARADAQVAMMKALVETLARLAPPVTTPTPILCVDSDGVTVVSCKAVVR